jgi:DNA excision repair protein ERCC-2
VEVAEELARLIEQGARVLFSAPVGWGKTHAVIAALLQARTLPALWLVRALALGNRIAEDAALWGLTIFVAAGREKTCPLWEQMQDAVHDFCRLARFKCPYARLPSPLPAASDWKELVEKARTENFCPYYAQDLVACDVLIQNYNRRIRGARAVVIDEAHNLAAPDERTIRISQLAEAVNAVRHAATGRLINALERMMRYILVKEGGLEATLFLGEEEREELFRTYRTLLVEEPARASTIYPLTLLVQNPAYIEGERIVIYKPRRALTFRPAILVTATPLLPLPVKIDAEVKILWQRKIPAVIVTSLSTKFDEFDSKMALNYKRLLIAVAKKYRRVLVFAASERVSKELEAWAQYIESVPPSAPSDWEGIVLLRARGRYSEGVNLSADAVVIAGAPYLPPEVTDRLVKVYKAEGQAEPLKLAVDAPMLAQTIQCIGRAWRDPASQPPKVMLADWRYTRYAKELGEFLEIEEHSLDELER